MLFYRINLKKSIIFYLNQNIYNSKEVGLGSSIKVKPTNSNARRIK